MKLLKSKIAKYTGSIALILCCHSTSMSQTNTNPLRKFEGTWVGNMETYQNSIITDKIKIKVEILKYSEYGYKWIYTFSPTKNTEIKKIETIRIINDFGDVSATTNNQFPITEYWINNKFYSGFISGNSYIVQTFYLEGKNLIIDIVKSEPENTDYSISTNTTNQYVKPSIILEIKKCILTKTN